VVWKCDCEDHFTLSKGGTYIEQNTILILFLKLHLQMTVCGPYSNAKYDFDFMPVAARVSTGMRVTSVKEIPNNNKPKVLWYEATWKFYFLFFLPRHL